MKTGKNQPSSIPTGRQLTASRLQILKAGGKCPGDLVHRQVKHLNNVVSADHGNLKQLIKPVSGFKTLKSAYATIKDFEVMQVLRKGQTAIFNMAAMSVEKHVSLSGLSASDQAR
ncbi:DDE-type integrase/transposase/recombinase [Rhizobium sp. BR 314]